MMLRYTACTAAGAAAGLALFAAAAYVWLCFGLDCSWLVEDE